MLGKIVRLTGSHVEIDDRGIVRRKEVDPKCLISLDGKLCEVADGRTALESAGLRPGDVVELSGQPATSIKATRGKAN